MGTENSRKRRRYGADLKTQVLAECEVPGASVAMLPIDQRSEGARAPKSSKQSKTKCGSSAKVRMKYEPQQSNLDRLISGRDA